MSIADVSHVHPAPVEKESPTFEGMGAIFPHTPETDRSDLAKSDPVRSDLAGPLSLGVAFRVWAPHADAVSVKGFSEENPENPWQQPLRREEQGTWYGLIPEAKEGDVYRYVVSNGEISVEKRDPYGRRVSEDKCSSVIYRPDAYSWRNTNFQMPAWSSLVLYELHIGTFNASGNASGNARGNSDKPGTFETCIQKLSYLKKLGVNGILLMPITAFPGEYSWGYNVTDLFAVENTYGGPDGFKRFIDACHDNGIAVILDVILNHLGPDHIDLWRFDGWFEHDGGGIYFYQDRRGETPWGQTRFDFGRGEVRTYLRDNVMMWLDEYRLDGLRYDATQFIRKISPSFDHTEIPEGWSLMQWLNDEKNRAAPWKLSIAEDISDEPWICKTTGEGGAGFDSQWDPTFVNILRQQLLASDDTKRNMADVKRAIEHGYNGEACQRIIYTESHDDVANGKARLTYEIDRDEGDNRSFYSKKRSILGVTIVMTSPGIPLLFQGQEMLENLWFDDQDPIDWFLSEKYKGIVQAYRDLIRLRKNMDGQSQGLQGEACRVHHVNDAGKVIAFHRWKNGGAGDDVMVLANFSLTKFKDYTIGMPRPGLWRVRFNSSSHLYDDYIDAFDTYDTEAVEGERDGCQWHASINMGAYGVVILSQDNSP